MKTKVTAVFDIGRTNKKFFLFDRDYQEVYREYTRFEEIKDEDGYPTENLSALKEWVKEVFDRMTDAPEYDIDRVNFSCYGATVVHLDEKGEVLTPMYNYTKPLSGAIADSFYEKYGPEERIARTTGSQRLDMLNTGMQLYWLKYAKPELFKRVKYTLHLPQYLSYTFTGVPVSEYTSIGCHTLLWDFDKKDYHDWVYSEGVDKVLPPLRTADASIDIAYKGKNIKVGVGIHDSSSALLPYIRSIEKRFVLVSTGTWSISINPFSNTGLTEGDIKNDCLFNMRIDGSPVKVSRLFLGNEYKIQIKLLSEHFKVGKDHHRMVKFDQELFSTVLENFSPMFKWISITSKEMPSETEIRFDTFEQAYHQLILELVLLQVESIKAAIGDTPVKRLYIDGGFTDNDVYIKLISHYLGKMKLRTTESSLGTSLGAAIVMSGAKLGPKFLKENYALKKHVPFTAN